MIKVYNTFCTERWLPLVQVLAESIIAFSKYKLVVNCINFEHNFNHSQIISKSIYINKCNNLNMLYRYKWSTLLEHDYDACVMLDADMIALPEIDNLLDNNEQYTDSKYPLFATHPHNPFESSLHRDALFAMMQLFTTNRPKMPYVYASGIVLKQHKSFIQEITQYIDWFNNNNIPAYIEDEGILNCLLSKHEATINLGYNYFPNATLYKDYISNNLENSDELYNTYLQHNCPVKFYALHGCKNSTEAKYIFNNIKNYTTL